MSGPYPVGSVFCRRRRIEELEKGLWLGGMEIKGYGLLGASFGAVRVKGHIEAVIPRLQAVGEEGGEGELPGELAVGRQQAGQVDDRPVVGRGTGRPRAVRQAGQAVLHAEGITGARVVDQAGDKRVFLRVVPFQIQAQQSAARVDSGHGQVSRAGRRQGRVGLPDGQGQRGPDNDDQSRGGCRQGDEAGAAFPWRGTGGRQIGRIQQAAGRRALPYGGPDVAGVPPLVQKAGQFLIKRGHWRSSILGAPGPWPGRSRI